jgi:dihydrofolate reductase
MTPTLTLIAALDQRQAIGRDNDLPWRLPDDLKRFKALTLGKPVLMGRKTAQSLGRALPGRLNLVLTRQGTVPFEGMTPCSTLEEALGYAEGHPEVMVIGGGDIYALTLPLASRLVLTHVQTETPDADAFFPAFDAAQWQQVSEEFHPADDRHALAFSFIDYARVGS